MSQGGSEKASMRKRHFISDLKDKQKLPGLQQVGKMLLDREDSICERSEQKEAWDVGGIETRTV